MSLSTLIDQHMFNKENLNVRHLLSSLAIFVPRDRSAAKGPLHNNHLTANKNTTSYCTFLPFVTSVRQLLTEVPLPWRTPFVDKLLGSSSCCCCGQQSRRIPEEFEVPVAQASIQVQETCAVKEGIVFFFVLETLTVWVLFILFI